MAWHDAYDYDELWEGQMVGVEVAGREVLLINIAGGVRAYENRCPHQQWPLSDGELEDGVLICSNHHWEFDVHTGCGVNPKDARLVEFPTRIEAGRILVDLG